jgi:hypothetical protein
LCAEPAGPNGKQASTFVFRSARSRPWVMGMQLVCVDCTRRYPTDQAMNGTQRVWSRCHDPRALRPYADGSRASAGRSRSFGAVHQQRHRTGRVSDLRAMSW